MRGIFLGLLLFRELLRIIPAGAGHFIDASSWTLSAPDHPRRCGAFLLACSIPIEVWGSSPQVRGILRLTAGAPTSVRIIPAGAGHLAAGCMRSRWNRDHPRRCGAFRGGFGYFSHVGGSSPQVRGISASVLRSSRISGIIPAGAGHLTASV